MATEAPQSSPDAASLTLFLPFFLGLPTSAFPPDQTGSGARSRPWPDRFVFINPFAQSLVVVGAGPDLPQSAKGGRPPASRASIEAMPCVEVEEGRECECAICLESVTAGESAREMPCKHRFHGGCIERWLGLHGTCPVCRHEMPLEEGEPCEKRGGGVWVSFGFGFGGDDSDDGDSSSS